MIGRYCSYTQPVVGGRPESCRYTLPLGCSYRACERLLIDGRVRRALDRGMTETPTLSLPPEYDPANRTRRVEGPMEVLSEEGVSLAVLKPGVTGAFLSTPREKDPAEGFVLSRWALERGYGRPESGVRARSVVQHVPLTEI